MVIVVAGLFGRSTKKGPTPLTEEAVAEARALIGRGKPVHAIKVVREHTGMGLAEAKNITDALAEGRQVPVAPTPGASLADRVRELRGQSRVPDAVDLVAAETGMTEAESARFIDSLD